MVKDYVFRIDVGIGAFEWIFSLRVNLLVHLFATEINARVPDCFPIFNLEVRDQCHDRLECLDAILSFSPDKTSGESDSQAI